ncbi:NAD(P)-binding domain-containing protein [Halobacteriovorax sp.]|uniref:NAD(P)-binding domain-containing protein n=1 Tax=Halobacteriovorax sp. TaxID=2020862 RepID=UPI003AF2A55D
MMTDSDNQEILIIGFGSQAKSWAMNLRDSKRNIHIGLRSNSSSIELANELGFKVLDIENLELPQYEFIIILTPDDTHKEILTSLKFSNKKSKQKFIYAHGYSVIYDELRKLLPHHEHMLLAPKAIASELRFGYETKAPLTAVINSDAESKDALRSLAKDLGITIGPIESSFREETICDLFSEQSLLCSVIPQAARLSFETLVNKGHSPEIAYIECWHEVKLIADAMIKHGPSALLKLISPNAFLGGEKAKSLIFDEGYQQKLHKIYNEIDNGQFAHEILHSDFQMQLKQAISEWDNLEISKVYQRFGKKLVHVNEKVNNEKN